MSTATQSLTLEEFLTLPETKPASEFINGEIVQKPMPQGEHSRLVKLCAVINQVTEDQRSRMRSQNCAVRLAESQLFPM